MVHMDMDTRLGRPHAIAQALVWGAIILIVAGAALFLIARPWGSAGSPTGSDGTAQGSAAAAVQPGPLSLSHSGEGWSIALASNSGSLAAATAVINWMERRVYLLDDPSGIPVASIQLSAYPMVATRRSNGELLISDKSFVSGAEAARLLILDANDNLVLKAEVKLDPKRIAYTSYWPGMALSDDESVLFYVTQSTRTELPECAGSAPAPANVCDRITVAAVDLTRVNTHIAAVELPRGCQPPPLSKASSRKAVLLTCDDGRAYEANVAGSGVALRPLSIVAAPKESTGAREGRPSFALYTIPLTSDRFGTLFADGAFIVRGPGAQAHRAVPEGMRPLLGGDDIYSLQSGKLLIAFGPEFSVFPQGVALFDPATGRINRIVELDPSDALTIAPDSPGTSLIVLTRRGAVRRIPLADGGSVVEGDLRSPLPEEVSLIP